MIDALFVWLVELFVSVTGVTGVIAVTARSGASGFHRPRLVVSVPDAPDVLGVAFHGCIAAAPKKVMAEQ